MLCNKRRHCSEKSAHRSWSVAPARCSQRKVCAAAKTQDSKKVSKWKFKKKKKRCGLYTMVGVCVSDVEMLCSESLSQNWCRKHKILQHQPKTLHLHTQHRWGQGCRSLDFPRLLVANDWVRGWLSSRPTPTPWREILPKDHFGLEKFIGLTKTFSKFQRGLRLFLFNSSIPLSFHRYQIWSKALLIYSSSLLL